MRQSPNSSTASSETENAGVDESGKDANLPALAAAIALSILIPILTFGVIPGFLGRMTVVSLVAGGVLGALMQSGVLSGRDILGREGMVCGGIYGGLMVVLAGISG